MSCAVGLRRGLDLTLLRLWCRPAATALIRSLAREPPQATSAALEKAKRQKKKKKARGSKARIGQVCSGHSPCYPIKFFMKDYSAASNSVLQKICYLAAEHKLRFLYTFPGMLTSACKWRESRETAEGEVTAHGEVDSG